ncbi:uncharacterized protein [Antedon mediterranea]|uniref:uncharacterized protein n=1 Tax=Antedon mediterranea TaxID=105859 RepID=UPI003AF63AC0
MEFQWKEFFPTGSVAAYLKKFMKNIILYFDVWHVAKEYAINVIEMAMYMAKSKTKELYYTPEIMCDPGTIAEKMQKPDKNEFVAKLLSRFKPILLLLGDNISLKLVRQQASSVFFYSSSEETGESSNDDIDKRGIHLYKETDSDHDDADSNYIPYEGSSDEESLTDNIESGETVRGQRKYTLLSFCHCSTDVVNVEVKLTTKLKENTERQWRYLLPATSCIFATQREKHFKSVMNVSCDMCCDSSGFTAKFGTYTTIDTAHSESYSHRIVQKDECPNSPAMELEVLKRTLSVLQGYGVTIKRLVSDRHISIAAFKKKTTTIIHYFDAWQYLFYSNYHK